MRALSIKDFSFAYPEREELLSDISLELEPGSCALLIGATGSGKTTLLRSIKPELAPAGSHSGTIEVFGRDIEDLDVSQSSTLIGFVSQSPDNQIVCDSVWHELAFGLENLGVAPDQMRRRVAEVAYFFGIEPWLHTPIDALSGGQKQILALASVLVMQPQLLLLDEPTAQLDPIAEKNFIHALFRINRELGITIVVATHTPHTMVAYATDAFRLHGKHVEPVDLKELVVPLPSHEGSIEHMTAPAVVPEAVVVMRDVFFRYQSDSPWVLRGADLTVERGSIQAIIGGNGSGKSTILQLIASILRPQRGSITNTLAHSQAYLPQDPKALFVTDSVEAEL
ncbi:MAG: ABC transporter ATP-binding protein, partial [Actinomycetia bacterium]|nr:ABC transporter ATP-binding protein [Actinomycetes bacterium]